MRDAASLNVLFLLLCSGATKILSRTDEVEWSQWGKWTECSRSCGVGVRHRSRRCDERNIHKDIGSRSNCDGDRVEYETCNIQACPEPNKDFRAEQCKEHNNKLFNKRRYRWEPYLKARNPCELACKVTGRGFYARMAPRVIDGTQCGTDGASICVNGECKRVGCDGVLGSSLVFDKCGVCGGDSNSCKVISGIFIRSPLTYGYNEIATIPIGACNIRIKEMRHSRNYLVLKKKKNKRYILNGQYAIDWSGDYKAAGTVFKYVRPLSTLPRKHEHITAKGPLSEEIILEVLYQEKNPGIEYQYAIPVQGAGRGGTSSSQHRAQNREQSVINKYLATDTVGKPITNNPSSHGQTRHHGRRRPETTDHSSTVTTANYDDGSRNRNRNWNKRGHRQKHQRPATNYGQLPPDLPTDRQTAPPTYSWRVSGFTTCSVTCGGGLQSTTVVCVASKSLAVVTDENCEAPIKPKVQTVNCGTEHCPPDWSVAAWTPCSATCGKGKRTRIVECKQRVSKKITFMVSATQCLKKPRPASMKYCQNPECYKWRAGPWSQCSVACGRGKHRRDVACVDTYGKQVSESFCEGRRPSNEEHCHSGSCAKDWLYTTWSDQCSSDCGAGKFKRKVFCSNQGGTCDSHHKPKTEKPCNNSIQCGAMWFTGPWSKCSDRCESEMQVRQVVCMRYVDTALQVMADNECSINDKPDGKQSCDMKSCVAEWYLSAWSECSVTCGAGQQSRRVMCLDDTQQTSVKCPADERPSDTRECNYGECATESPLDPSCKDRMQRCRTVVQARLCKYGYYKNLCCESCTKHQRRHRLQRHL